jgi:GNAT superfamily N-acetyltransferase
VEVNIRTATIEDGRALARLRWDSSDKDESFEVFEERFARFWSQREGWTVWVAEVDGAIVSNMWLYRVPRVPQPGQTRDAHGYLTSVYTSPEARNRGIGAAILERIVAWGRDNGLEGIFVSPSDESVPFYERAGFVWSKQWMEVVYE